MIQRIQSVYLLLTTLLSLLFLNGSFSSFIDKTGSLIKLTFKGITRDSGIQGSELIQKLLPLSIIIILIPLVSLIALFHFKKRKIQLRLTASLIILAASLLIVSAYYHWVVVSQYNGELIPGLKMVLPVFILIFAILAYSGIRKDDRLIKSYDRLR